MRTGLEGVKKRKVVSRTLIIEAKLFVWSLVRQQLQSD